MSRKAGPKRGPRRGWTTSLRRVVCSRQPTITNSVRSSCSWLSAWRKRWRGEVIWSPRPGPARASRWPTLFRRCWPRWKADAKRSSRPTRSICKSSCSTKTFPWSRSCCRWSLMRPCSRGGRTICVRAACTKRWKTGRSFSPRPRRWSWSASSIGAAARATDPWPTLIRCPILRSGIWSAARRGSAPSDPAAAGTVRAVFTSRPVAGWTRRTLWCSTTVSFSSCWEGATLSRRKARAIFTRTTFSSSTRPTPLRTWRPSTSESASRNTNCATCCRECGIRGRKKVCSSR